MRASTGVRKFGLMGREEAWTFTRADLERVLAKVTEREPRRAPPA